MKKYYYLDGSIIMKKSIKCYICIYCQNCSKEQEERCSKMDYALFTTEDDKKLCDLICGEPQDED
jgi:hypothetical protein